MSITEFVLIKRFVCTDAFIFVLMVICRITMRIIVVITEQFYDLLETQSLTDIWVAFGMGSFYHINASSRNLWFLPQQPISVQDSRHVT